jgi:hypothetical protein
MQMPLREAYLLVWPIANKQIKSDALRKTHPCSDGKQQSMSQQTRQYQSAVLKQGGVLTDFAGKGNRQGNLSAETCKVQADAKCATD